MLDHPVDGLFHNLLRLLADARADFSKPGLLIRAQTYFRVSVGVGDSCLTVTNGTPSQAQL